MLAMPWLATGTFVYQSFISDSKMWTIYTIPKAFMVYSITSIATLFLSGFLVDKFTSRKLLPYMNLPSLISMLVLFYFDSYISAYFVLGLMGVSNGLANGSGLVGKNLMLHPLGYVEGKFNKFLGSFIGPEGCCIASQEFYETLKDVGSSAKLYAKTVSDILSD